MKINFKALGLAAIMGVSMLGMTACSDVNYMDKYKDYLDYSLGNWEVIDDSRSIKDNKKYTKWTVTFKNAYAEDVRYIFSNETEAESDIAFGSTVAVVALDIVEDELTKNVLEKNLKADELGRNAYAKNESGFSAAYIINDLESSAEDNAKYVKSLISPKDGIKLSELTAAKYLTDKPRFAYVYCLTDSEDKAEQAEMEKKVDLLVEETRAYAGENVNVVGILNFMYSDGSKKPIYSKSYIQGEEIVFDRSLEENKESNAGYNYQNKIKERYNID